VVNDLSFTVKPGRVTGFLGPNGAGKSTTMKILLDLASADEGPRRSGARDTEISRTQHGLWGSSWSPTHSTRVAAAEIIFGSLPMAAGSRQNASKRCSRCSASTMPRTGA